MADEKKRTRKRLDYNAIAPEAATDMLASLDNNSTTNPKTGCKLFQGSVNTDGYAQIQRRDREDHKKKNYLGHIVALRSAGRPAPGKGEQASHLCHQRNCFLAAHIVVETTLENNRRKGCRGAIVCEQCFHVNVICSHDPKCVPT